MGNNLTSPGQVARPAPLVIRMGDWGLCSQIANYLYSYIYALDKGLELIVDSRKSCIAPEFNLIKEILKPDSRVKFGPLEKVEKFPNSFNSKIVLQHCRALDRKRVKTLCRQAYQLNFTTKERIYRIWDREKWTNVPFHVGIHYRSGDKLKKEMRPVSLKQFSDALLKCNLNRPVTNVFIMSDNYKALQGLKQELSNAVGTKTRLVFFSACKPDMLGHQQTQFNKQSVEKKKADLLVLLAEIEVMRRIPCLLLLLSSNVDRLIYNTHHLDDENITLQRIDDNNLIA